MINSIIKFDKDGRDEVLEGMDIVANAVKVTLGAKGRNVLIKNIYGQTQATKDGVTVARSIHVHDLIKSIGANMVQEAAINTVDEAGDGTTTASLLTQAIVRAGIKHLGSGANPMDLKRGIDKAVAKVVAQLKELSKKADKMEDLRRIATISANNDAELGGFVIEAIEKVGRKGYIRVEDAKGYETKVKVTEGVMLNSGFISYGFITNEKKMKFECEDCYILVTDMKIKKVKDILPLLEQIAQEKKPLVIVAEGMDMSVVTTLLQNKVNKVLDVCVVKPPEFAENRKLFLEDLAIATDAMFLSEEAGFKMELVSLNHLGKAASVEVTRDTCLVVGGKGKKEDIAIRVNQIEEMLNDTNIEITDHDKSKLNERLANLKDGVAVISVGGVTETEVNEKKDRIDDAKCAVKSADEEGFVAGGGVSFLICSAALNDMKGENDDETTGIRIVQEAIKEQFRMILKNGGVEPAEYIFKIKEKPYGWGYNIKTDTMEDFLITGVIDPTKVLRVSLENAASIATIFLTTECVIAQEYKKDSDTK